MNLRAYAALTVASLKIYARNPLAASAVFIGLLGLVIALKFLGDGSPHLKVDLTDVAQSPRSTSITSTISGLQAFTVTATDEATARADIDGGRADLSITLQPDADGRVVVHLSYKESPRASTGVLLLHGALGDLDLAALGGMPPVVLESAPIAARPTTPIDGTLPGLLAFNIIQSSLVFAAGVIASYRATGVLRRIQATGLDAATFVLATATATFVIAFGQTVALVLVARLLYDMHLELVPLLAVTALGIVIFLALGLAVAGFVRDAQRAPSVATTIAMPMIFIGLFPVDSLPNMLAPVLNALPITFITTAMRQIVDDPSVSLLPQFAGLAAWAVVALVAAARAFRWD